MLSSRQSASGASSAAVPVPLARRWRPRPGAPRHFQVVRIVADHHDRLAGTPVAAAKACTMSGAGFGRATDIVA